MTFKKRSICSLMLSVLWGAANIKLSFATVVDPLTDGATMSELPEPEWVSLSPSLEFKPALDQQHVPGMRLRHSTMAMSSSQLSRGLRYASSLVDGSETRYDEYSQAFRLLGLFVHCHAQGQQQQEEPQADENHRRLDQHEAAQDDDDDDVEEANAENNNANNANANNNNSGALSCKRYLLWAAYVDPNYQGLGTGGYQFYDLPTKKWDRTACLVTGTDQCAKMDCHLAGTKFQLLGFFRAEYPVAWIQTVTQREGSCFWNSNDYQFMAKALQWLPQQCTATQVYDAGKVLYLDIKPDSNGGIGIGLYTDNTCTKDYQGSTSVDTVFNKYYGSIGDGYSNLANRLARLNSILGTFRICQPCRTYDLSYVRGGQQNAADSSDPNRGYFICEDKAGGQGVNQCNLFKQNTGMSMATSYDVAVAGQQGTLARTYVADASQGFWARFWFLILSIIVFVLGVVLMCFGPVMRHRRKRSSHHTSRREPLLGSSTNNHH